MLTSCISFKSFAKYIDNFLTIPYTEGVKYEKRRFLLMAFKISDACISCGTCEAACPVAAICEGNGKFEIKSDVCIDCGTCAGACPVSAIEPEE